MSEKYQFSQIQLSVSENIATITLNRPEKLNAFTNKMLHEIIAAFDLTDDDDDVRAVIVTGAGRAFCAGADLSSGGETFSRGGSDVQGVSGVPRDGGGLVSLRIFNSKKPVIGAINGPAVGVGVTMTLPMDIRLASNTSKFGFVFNSNSTTLAVTTSANNSGSRYACSTPPTSETSSSETWSSEKSWPSSASLFCSSAVRRAARRLDTADWCVSVHTMSVTCVCGVCVCVRTHVNVVCSCICT